MLSSREFPLQIVKRAHRPFDGDDWLFEIKHDGFRVLAIRDGGPARLYTRNGYDIGARHPHIIERLNRLPACRFVLDGELVVLDEDGRSNFARLAHGRQGTHYYAFDLLLLECDDLRGYPLEERKTALEKLAGGYDPVRYTDHLVGTGRAFFEAVKDAGLEGMVAKRRRSLYAGRLTNDWLKIKCLRVHDFVIGGWIPDGREPFRELLLGAYIDGKLRYVGRVGAGFNSRVTRAIKRMLEPASEPPFADRVPEAQARFCAPTLRISVEFLDLTDDGYLRHASFRRFADELVRRN